MIAAVAEGRSAPRRPVQSGGGHLHRGLGGGLPDGGPESALTQELGAGSGHQIVRPGG